jgi:hypothetical protein
MKINSLIEIRPKAKYGPASGISSWILFGIILASTEMAFYILLTLELVQLDQLEIWLVGASLGIVASLMYYVLTRAVYNQGKRAGERYGGF